MSYLVLTTRTTEKFNLTRPKASCWHIKTQICHGLSDSQTAPFYHLYGPTAGEKVTEGPAEQKPSFQMSYDAFLQKDVKPLCMLSTLGVLNNSTSRESCLSFRKLKLLTKCSCEKADISIEL